MNTGQRGSSLLFFLIINLLTCLTFLIFTKVLIYNEKIYRLIELKKCHQRIIYLSSEYVKKQLQKNKIIKKINYLKIIPKATRILSVLEKTMILSQEISFFVYQAKISNLTVCQHISTTHFQSKSIFSRKFKFIRSSKKLLRKKKLFALNLISNKIPFLIRTNLEIKNEHLQHNSWLINYGK